MALTLWARLAPAVMLNVAEPVAATVKVPTACVAKAGNSIDPVAEIFAIAETDDEKARVADAVAGLTWLALATTVRGDTATLAVA